MAFLNQPQGVAGLVHVVAVPLPEIAETLDADRKRAPDHDSAYTVLLHGRFIKPLSCRPSRELRLPAQPPLSSTTSYQRARPSPKVNLGPSLPKLVLANTAPSIVSTSNPADTLRRAPWLAGTNALPALTQPASTQAPA